MNGFFSQKKNKLLARTIVLGLCLGFFSHARAAAPSDFETEEYFKSSYRDTSIAKQGTLSIDGSVAGDACSMEKGTIAGRGTIHGTLYNNNIAVAGDATGSGNLTMDTLVSRDASFTRGRHDKDFSCSVTVKRMW